MRARQGNSNSDELGVFGQVVSDRLNDLGWKIRDLAERVDVTYECCRRVWRGESDPSDGTLNFICTALDLDFAKMKRLVQADRLRRKYGRDVVMQLIGASATIEPVQRAWDDLTEQHQKDVVGIVKSWARADKQRSRPDSQASSGGA